MKLTSWVILQFLLPNVAFWSFYDFKFNFQKNTWKKQEGTKNGIKRNHHLDDLAARLQSFLGGLQIQECALNPTQSQKQKLDAWLLVKCSDKFRAQFCDWHNHKLRFAFLWLKKKFMQVKKLWEVHFVTERDSICSCS